MPSMLDYYTPILYLIKRLALFLCELYDKIIRVMMYIICL